MLTTLAFFALLGISQATFARSETENKQIQVVMLTDGSLEHRNFAKVLQREDSGAFLKKQYNGNSVSSLLGALDEVQKMNEENPKDKRAHVVFLPVSDVRRVEGKRDSIKDGQARLIKKAIQTISENGSTVVVPAGNESARINGADGTVIPAAYEETVTISSLERYKRHPIRLSPFSNYGKSIDAGILLFENRLNVRGSIQLNKNTRSAAMFAARAIAEYKAEVLSETGKIPKTKHVLQEIYKQAETKNGMNGYSKWHKDPDGIQEPMLTIRGRGLEYTGDYYRDEDEEEQEDKVTVTVHPVNDGTHQTIQYQVEEIFAPEWTFLHSWNNLEEASPKTFTLKCGMLSSVKLHTKVEQKPDLDMPFIDDKQTRTDQITISCDERDEVTWKTSK